MNRHATIWAILMAIFAGLLIWMWSKPDNISLPFIGANISENLKLKTTKDKIISSEIIDDINCLSVAPHTCVNKGKIVQYIYRSDKKADIKEKDIKGEKWTEDITRRTGNAVFYKVKNKLLGAADSLEVERADFYARDIFYQDATTSEWYEIPPPATTTIEAYTAQTISLGEKIKRFFVNTVLAEQYLPEAGGDGTAAQDSGVTTWALWRNGAGSGHNHSTIDCYTEWYNVNSKYYGGRGFAPFNTAALPDDATITGSVFTANLISNYNTVNFDNDASAYVGISSSTEASSAAVVTADFPRSGSTLMSEKKMVSGLGTGTTTITMTDYSSVSLTGYTFLSLREGHDMDNHPILSGVGYDTQTGLSFEAGGNVGNRTPYLSVTYTTGGGGGTTIIPPTSGDEDIYYY